MDLPLNRVKSFPDLGRALGHMIAFTHTLEAHGVTPLEYQAMLLMKIRPDESITLEELARQLKLTGKFCLRLAEQLSKNDFAVRRLSSRPADTVVQLTSHGGEILADLAARHIEELRSLEQILAEALPRLRGG